LSYGEIENMMVVNLIDKIFFGLVLLAAFQVPILSEHYLQFVNGYYQSTSNQVDGYKVNALNHGYASVESMVSDLKNSANSVVRDDAIQKQKTLREFYELQQGVQLLKTGNIFQKAWYIFNPTRWHVLKQVLQNFKPGMPLSVWDIIYSTLFALLISTLLLWPFRRKKK